MVLFGTVLSAQKITLSGYVQDAKTKEKLIGATVYIPSLKIGTQTNAYGFYSITFIRGKEELMVKASYIGYKIDSLSAPVSTSSHVFNLPPNKDLTEVVVKSKRSEPIHESTQMSKIDLPISTIKKLPAFLGEVDVLKAIQLLPGVQAGGEGQNGLYVRGGGPDQNLILLDGIPVYNASHLFGFFSVFNADAVSSVEVYKGGFPARYGGRLSSVIDIRMKEGDRSGVHGSIGIGLIASRGLLEGPIGKKKDKGSWMISGRRTYIDLLAAPIILAASNGQGVGGYYFYDLNAKVNYRIGKRDRIYLSSYLGNDKFYFRTFGNNDEENFKAAIQWGNITALARWNHEFSPKVFGNLSATFSRYKFGVSSKLTNTDITGANTSFSALYSSFIRDWAMKYDVDFIPNPKHYIKTGASATFHKFTPGAITVKNSGFPDDNIDTAFNVEQTPEIDLYVEDDIELTKKWKANIGVHFSGFKTKNNFYTSLQPRLSSRYLLTKTLSMKASYSQMTQFIHLLTNNGIGLPTDLWVPVTDKIKPQQSHQVALGFAQLIKDQYEFSVEGYYKNMNNIIDYKEGSSFLNTNQSWENKVEMGRGWSYGGEVFVQKKTGRLTGMMGYTLSWTNRKFPTINFGKTYPYKYDRRHDFKIAAVYKMDEKIEFSGEWLYGTGNATTMPLYRYNASPNSNSGFNYFGDQFYYGERNQYRLRAYHRLDFGVNITKKLRKGRERTWNFSVYNVYSRMNPYFVYQEYDYQKNKYQFRQISLFPMLPAFSYNLKF